MSDASPEDYVEMGGKYIQKQYWRRGRMRLMSGLRKCNLLNISWEATQAGP